jgi:subtilisin family serine protease
VLNQTAFSLTRLCAGVSLALLALSASAATSGNETKRFVVEFKPGQAAAARAALANAGGRIKLEILGGDAVAIELPVKMVAMLKKHFAIEEISEDAVRRPFGTTTGQSAVAGQVVPYGISLVQADQLSDANTANRTVCIIDSGYDISHEDLSLNNVTGEDDPNGAGLWTQDDVHHGTHVAGTIAGINNGVGVVGVNPNKHIKLHIIKVFDASGWAYSSTLVNAAKHCQAAGANVISMSLGGSLLNPLEQKAFGNLYNAGILSIAAAGNAGNKTISYPAGYSSVVSVAAVDSNKAWASFSQFNKDVELAGPGVAVLSTVPMGTGTESTLTVGTTTYAPGGMDGSPTGTASAPLADFGLGDVVNTAVAGKVCLIARGTIAFSDKVLNCQNSGGVGAIVYNNVAGGFGGTLGGVATTIPSVTASDTEGATLLTQLGQTANLGVTPTNYAYFDGTSMATPHVSGVAALVWSYFPTCTAAQIRVSLQKSALDLGAAGRDVYTGYGLVQAKAAYTRIKNRGCGV